jgi:protein-tyrosine phosphatase
VTDVLQSEIIPGLFVGNRYAAEALGRVVPVGWTCIAVTEYDGRLRTKKNEIPNEPALALRFPFMDEPMRSRISMLDQIAVEIDRSLRADKRVLVHGVQANERSPLAIAWYLMWSKRAPDLAAAYDLVYAKHPATELRFEWVRQP